MTKLNVGIRSGNKGLTVKINLFALPLSYSAEAARLWIKGQVTSGDTKEKRFFQDAGQLLTILGEWNRKKLKWCQARSTSRRKQGG